jgi:hypothetical protein
VITVVEYLASAYDFPNDAVTIDVISIRIVMNNNTVIRFVFIIESELTSVRINWYKVLPICVKLYIRNTYPHQRNRVVGSLWICITEGEQGLV